MFDYYDAVLGLIPLAFGGIAGTLLVIGLSLSAAVSIGALVAAGVIGHGMFVRTPGRFPHTTSRSSTSTDHSDRSEYSPAD